jgi:N-acetylmuramoyl-L-alanine amidase
MKKLTILMFFAVFLYSCDKKETPKNVEPVIQKTAPEIEEIPQTKTETPKLIFTVQIAALKTQNDDLKNLESVRIYKENGFTKYCLGSFDTYKEAKQYNNQIQYKYKGAFVQAFKNNEPIEILEAL